MKKTLFGILLFSLSTTHVIANELVGAGLYSCAEWSNSRAQAEQSNSEMLKQGMYASWIQGFLSGANVQRAGVLDLKTNGEVLTLPNSGTILSYLDNYCRSNQLHDLYDASFSLFVNIRDNQ